MRSRVVLAIWFLLVNAFSGVVSAAPSVSTPATAASATQYDPGARDDGEAADHRQFVDAMGTPYAEARLTLFCRMTGGGDPTLEAAKDGDDCDTTAYPVREPVQSRVTITVEVTSISDEDVTIGYTPGVILSDGSFRWPEAMWMDGESVEDLADPAWGMIPPGETVSVESVFAFDTAVDIVRLVWGRDNDFPTVMLPVDDPVVDERPSLVTSDEQAAAWSWDGKELGTVELVSTQQGWSDWSNNVEVPNRGNEWYAVTIRVTAGELPISVGEEVWFWNGQGLRGLQDTYVYTNPSDVTYLAANGSVVEPGQTLDLTILTELPADQGVQHIGLTLVEDGGWYTRPNVIFQLRDDEWPTRDVDRDPSDPADGLVMPYIYGAMTVEEAQAGIPIRTVRGTQIGTIWVNGAAREATTDDSNDMVNIYTEIDADPALGQPLTLSWGWVQFSDGSSISIDHVRVRGSVEEQRIDTVQIPAGESVGMMISAPAQSGAAIVGLRVATADGTQVFATVEERVDPETEPQSATRERVVARADVTTSDGEPGSTVYDIDIAMTSQSTLATHVWLRSAVYCVDAGDEALRREHVTIVPDVGNALEVVPINEEEPTLISARFIVPEGIGLCGLQFGAMDDTGQHVRTEFIVPLADAPGGGANPVGAVWDRRQA